MVMGLGRSANDEIVSNCPICLEPMDIKGDNRTLVQLRCDHQYHIDCIGSAFNAKNKMECPLCRNVEQGRWLYATGLPVSDFTENRIPDPPVGVFTDLAFGMELCPFVAFGQFNPFVHLNMLCPNILNHQLGPGGGPICPYIEYTITFPQFPIPVGVTGSTNFSNQTIYGSENVSHRSNPSHHLVPLSHLPTNPRIFRSVLQPEVIRARHYFMHPLSNPDLTGGFGNSPMSNVPMFPPYPGGSLVHNAPAVPPYLGGSLVTNAAVANALRSQTNVGRNLSFNPNVATASISQPYQDSRSFANAPVVRPDLGSILVSNAPVANAPIAHRNIGDNLWGSAAIANASMASPYQDGSSLANAPMVWPNLGSRGNGSHVFGAGESSNGVGSGEESNNGVGNGNGRNGRNG